MTSERSLTWSLSPVSIIVAAIVTCASTVCCGCWTTVARQSDRCHGVATSIYNTLQSRRCKPVFTSGDIIDKQRFRSIVYNCQVWHVTIRNHTRVQHDENLVGDQILEGKDYRQNDLSYIPVDRWVARGRWIVGNCSIWNWRIEGQIDTNAGVNNWLGMRKCKGKYVGIFSLTDLTLLFCFVLFLRLAIWCSPRWNKIASCCRSNKPVLSWWRQLSIWIRWHFCHLPMWPNRNLSYLV